MSHNMSPMINESSSWYDCDSRHSPFAALNGIESDYYTTTFAILACLPVQKTRVVQSYNFCRHMPPSSY